MQFVLIGLLLVISFSTKTFAQARLKASPAKSQALCSQELNPLPPLPKSLKEALNTVVKVRAALNSNPHFETLYLSKLQELKIQFLAHQIGEEIFDQYFVAAYQLELKKISATKEDVKEVQVETQKERILYPLKGRTPQVIRAISHALNWPIEKIGWDHLLSINSLDLSSVSLTKLKENDFEGLTSLKHLDLRYNSNLKTLPPKIFSTLKKLERIELEHCGLTKLPESLFQGLNKLEAIDLGDNKLKEIPEALFKGLKKLNFLELSRNPLKNLPPTLFEDLYSLTTLKLENIQISSLPEGIFDSLNKLEILDLGFNDLKTLPKLKKYTKLTLYLSHNKIQNLSQNELNHLKKLDLLIIKNNLLNEKTCDWIKTYVLRAFI